MDCVRYHKHICLTRPIVLVDDVFCSTLSLFVCCVWFVCLCSLRWKVLYKLELFVHFSKSLHGQTIFINRGVWISQHRSCFLSRNWPNVQLTCVHVGTYLLSLCHFFGNSCESPCSSRPAITARAFSLTSLLSISMWSSPSYWTRKATGTRVIT